MQYIIIAVDSAVFPERLFTEHFILLHAFFYKQQFFNLHQAEIGKKCEDITNSKLYDKLPIQDF